MTAQKNIWPNILAQKFVYEKNLKKHISLLDNRMNLLIA